jgi:cytoskeletal protein RodZ
MKSLGEFLRAERQARGISLEQISADTRISMDMLLAIEDGNVKQLPAPVLIKGFLRAYANRVDLDPDAVIVEYQDLIEEVGDSRETMEKFHQRLHPKSSQKKILALLIALTMLAGLAFLLYSSISVRQQLLPSTREKEVDSAGAGQIVAKKDSDSGLNLRETTTKFQQSSGQSEAGSEPGRSGLNDQTPTLAPPDEKVSNIGEDGVHPSAESEQPLTSLAAAQAPYVLRAEAMETTWLRIVIDESREREYLLQPDEQMTWLAKSSCKLLIGNAAGLRLYLNDQPLKPLGGRGQVVQLELPDASLLLITDSEQTEALRRP